MTDSENSIPEPDNGTSSWLALLPDLLAFCFGLGLAYFLSWKTTDLVWSLWLSSLFLGYLSIICTIAAGLVLLLAGIVQQGGIKDPNFGVLLGLGLFGSLFLLGFFSLHFCGFHAGHAAFLSEFFPLEGVKPEEFAENFVWPPGLFAIAFQHLVPAYGWFLLPAMVAERKGIFGHLISASDAVRSDKNSLDISQSNRKELNTEDRENLRKKIGDPFFGPYKNVIRMHILIFFFAGTSFFGVESIFVYAVVYFVYFFPWTEVFKKYAKKRA